MKALLVIGMQEDIIEMCEKKNYFTSVSKQEIIDNVNKHIKHYAEENQEIIYINNQYPNSFAFRKVFGYTLRGTKGAKNIKDLVIASNTIFEKSITNVFKNGLLVKYLRRACVTKIEIVGLDYNNFVMETAKESIKFGFKPVLIKDSIATADDRCYAKMYDKQVACI
ncbi:isochorismatase family protein [Clostridium sp. MSJ-8]|uniref:isochorismatase family protein n=1 Tax=Clostridium sp. MSJ-8 TaxID=2841510 RepID=UPI001C0F0011|nr:isochorismatase family protein [Clostridium sp. MSJ-8]MBU5486645.1 isochorismatase family protein [Clostridium sp. MSJ-8]